MNEDRFTDSDTEKLRNDTQQAASEVTKATMAAASGAAQGIVKTAWKPLVAFFLLALTAMAGVSAVVVGVLYLIFSQ